MLFARLAARRFNLVFVLAVVAIIDERTVAFIMAVTSETVLFGQRLLVSAVVAVMIVRSVTEIGNDLFLFRIITAVFVGLILYDIEIFIFG